MKSKSKIEKGFEELGASHTFWGVALREDSPPLSPKPKPAVSQSVEKVPVDFREGPPTTAGELEADESLEGLGERSWEELLFLPMATRAGAGETFTRLSDFALATLGDNLGDNPLGFKCFSALGCSAGDTEFNDESFVLGLGDADLSVFNFLNEPLSLLMLGLDLGEGTLDFGEAVFTESLISFLPQSTSLFEDIPLRPESSCPFPSPCNNGDCP